MTLADQDAIELTETNEDTRILSVTPVTGPAVDLKGMYAEDDLTADFGAIVSGPRFVYATVRAPDLKALDTGQLVIQPADQPTSFTIKQVHRNQVSRLTTLELQYS